MNNQLTQKFLRDPTTEPGLHRTKNQKHFLNFFPKNLRIKNQKFSTLFVT